MKRECRGGIEFSNAVFEYLSFSFESVFKDILRSIEFDNSSFKLCPLVCGSLVEGLLTLKSDVDFALLIKGEPSDREMLIIRKFLSIFLKKTEPTLKKEFELKGFCHFSKFIRRSSRLMTPSRSNSASFRLLFYTFSRPLDVSSFTDILASREDIKQFKLTFIKQLIPYYRGIGFNIKEFWRATPKSLLKLIQLGINHAILMNVVNDSELIYLTSKNIFTKVNVLKEYLTNIDLEVLSEAIDVLLTLKELYRRHNMKRTSLKKLVTEGHITRDATRIIIKALRIASLLKSIY